MIGATPGIPGAVEISRNLYRSGTVLDCTQAVVLECFTDPEALWVSGCRYMAQSKSQKAGPVSPAERRKEPMTFHPKALFQCDPRHDGVRRMNIYLLRLLYVLMFFVLGWQTWTHVLTHRGPWEPMDAVAWCVWTAFATLAGLGILRPVKMLPIVLLEVFYKVLWLGLVAYPLWRQGTLAGSPAEGTTSAFLWVILPIAAVPWGYAFATYVYRPKRAEHVVQVSSIGHLASRASQRGEVN